MKRYWDSVILFALLIVVMMSTSNARADYVYAFSGTDAISGGGANSFSFTEPSLITATGAFAITPFSLGTDNYTSAFFNASNDCFSFSTTTAVSCNFSASGDSFFGEFPGAITVGTFARTSAGCAESGGHVCEIVNSVTISATPEPSGILLLGSGMLGLAGVLRRRWKS